MFGILYVEVFYFKNYYEFIIEFGVIKLNFIVFYLILSLLIFFSNFVWIFDRNCVIEFFCICYKINIDKKKYFNYFNKKMSYFDILFLIYILYEFDFLLVLIVFKLYIVWSKCLEMYVFKI